MSLYTITLRDIMESEQTKPLLTKSMSTYELYTPKHEQLYGFIPTREQLNERILNHYKYYEISYETIGRFLDEFEIALKEIMPRYNQWYASVDIINNLENIFDNVDVVHTYEEEVTTNATGKITGDSTSDSNSTTNSSVTNNHKNVETTTPQGDITSINAKGIDTVTHADKIDWDENISIDTASNTGHDTTNSESNSEANETKTTTHRLTRKGNQGVNTYAHDMLEFRELFKNIEQDIIHDPRIAEQFMLIW